MSRTVRRHKRQDGQDTRLPVANIAEACVFADGDAAERLARLRTQRLSDIKASIHERCLATTDDHGTPGDYVDGASVSAPAS